MKRIFIFGDSILRGVYFSSETGRHKLFADRFSLLREDAEVVNCSIMGATITTGERLVKQRLEPACVPATELQEGTDKAESADKQPDGGDVVIFEYGGNDADYRWKDISENPSGAFLPNTPQDRYAARYGECVDYAKRTGARVFLCSLVPLDEARYMDWISRGLSRSNILKWLGDPSRLFRRQEDYSRTAERVAARCGCPVIDLRTPFLSRIPELLSDDGIHPTPDGHRLIDRLITEAVG